MSSNKLKVIFVASLTFVCAMAITGLFATKANRAAEEQAITEARLLAEAEAQAELDALKAREVILTDSKLSSITSELSQYTYVKLKQTMLNLDSEGNTTTEVSYILEVDLLNDIVYTSIHTDVDGEAYDFDYVSDIENDLHYTYKENDDSWIYKEDVTIMLASNLLYAEDVGSFYTELSKDLEFEENLVGYVDIVGGSLETYTITREADEESLTGVDYDSLGDERVTLLLLATEDGTAIPKSITTEIDYIVGENTYTCSVCIEITDYSNSELELPLLEGEEASD